MTLGSVAARNVLRNKFRTLLTIFGVAVAVLTFVLIRTVLYAWTSAGDYAAKDRIVTRHKVTFVMTLPKRYADDLASKKVAGIEKSGHASWFGGKDPNHDREFFGTFAINDAYLDVYSEFSTPKAELEDWKKNKQGAIVGDVLAKKLGWKVGDRVTLQSGIYPDPPDGPWTFTISAIYTATAKSVDRSTFLFHYDYLNDAQPANRKDQIGWIASRVSSGESAPDLSLKIDKHFDAEDIQTLSQDERAFNSSFLAGISAILGAMNLVSGVILVIMLLILGNTIAMGVRERTQEYGVLRAIGFLPKHIVIFIMGEAIVTGAIGGAVGLAISYPIVQGGMGRWLEENMGNFFPYFRIPLGDAVLAFALSLVLGALAGLLPALGASKLKVTEALRRVA